MFFLQKTCIFMFAIVENSAASPLTFELDINIGFTNGFEAIRLIEGTLQAYENKQREEEIRNKETALFDTWIRVLDAQAQFGREKSKPISYDSVTFKSPWVILHTNQNVEDIQMGETWVIEGPDGKRIRGEIWGVGPGEIVLNCFGTSFSNFPNKGTARLDQYAMKVAIDRQREAVDKIRSGAVTNSLLKDIINNPSAAMKPDTEVNLNPEIEKIIDKSKQNALKKALGCKDVLLIEGPPGTGKTTFISTLVSEEIRRNPKTKILIASQTHVAIDNALEKVEKLDNKIKIIRIASSQYSNISATSEKYLIDSQLKSWRIEASTNAEKGIEKWANDSNLDIKDVKIGTLIQKIANLKERVSNCRQKIKEEEQRKTSLENDRQDPSKNVNTVEIDQISEELDEYRNQLHSDTQELEKLSKSLVNIRPDAKTLISTTTQEQLAWAEALAGASKQELLAKNILDIQSEWFDRFANVQGFIKPLVGRSSVVAATCLGLAALSEINEVDFDLCIIDEASKATAMECAVPMTRAKKWILVGDSKQLGPFQEEILINQELKERFDIGSPEASESLFQRLKRLLPSENTVLLNEQYRMVAPIRKLISECFYDGKLIGGPEKLNRFICSETGKSINWFSTSLLSQRKEHQEGKSYSNVEEVNQICTLILKMDKKISKMLAKNRVKDRKIFEMLILSGYGPQSVLLKHRISQLSREIDAFTIVCSTIDQVQGKEARYSNIFFDAIQC